jgi:hypothetical protein
VIKIDTQGKAITSKKEMACGDGSGNIELEKRVCNSQVQLERLETLQTKSFLEHYWL